MLKADGLATLFNFRFVKKNIMIKAPVQTFMAATNDSSSCADVLQKDFSSIYWLNLQRNNYAGASF